MTDQEIATLQRLDRIESLEREQGRLKQYAVEADKRIRALSERLQRLERRLKEQGG